MKKILIPACLTCLVMFSGTATVSAQDIGMVAIPVELFACSYNDRQDADDLDAVIGRWNRWADDQGIDDYAAWTLTPSYYGPEQDFDLLWLGAGKTGAALGRSQDLFRETGGDIGDAFSEVLSCDAHVGFASLNFKAMPDNATPSDSVISFSDCSFEDGATFSRFAAAMNEWAEFWGGLGSTVGTFVWFPIYGGGDEDFDFKWIDVHQNMEDLGSDFDRFGTGGAIAKSGQLFGHLVECDSSRAYRATSRRFAQLR